jgi:hypothetical protein
MNAKRLRLFALSSFGFTARNWVGAWLTGVVDFNNCALGGGRDGNREGDGMVSHGGPPFE